MKCQQAVRCRRWLLRMRRRRASLGNQCERPHTFRAAGLSEIYNIVTCSFRYSGE